MWIIIGGLVSTSLFVSYYLTNSSAIMVDKKNRKIIISDKTPPIVINFSDLVNVDLVASGTSTKDGSIALKITLASADNPIYVSFVNNESKKSSYKNAKSRAQALHIKLTKIINSTHNLKTGKVSILNSAELQLEKLKEFKTNIIRQSAG